MRKRAKKSPPSTNRRQAKKTQPLKNSKSPNRGISNYLPGAAHKENGDFAVQLTPKKREEFLNQLRDHSNVVRACEEIGFSKVSLYALRRRDEEFAKEWEAAEKEGARCLEDEAKRRAMGYEEKVYKNGVYVGRVKKYSDLLLLALLNAHWPEKYRRSNGDQPPAIPPEDQKRLDEARSVLKRLNTDELSTIATVMEKATTRAVAQAVGVNGKRTLQ